MKESSDKRRYMDSEFGQMINKNFTTFPSWKRKHLVMDGFMSFTAFAMGILALTLDFVVKKELSLYDFIIMKLGGISVLWLGIFIFHKIVNYHDYVLFEKGILGPGYWFRKNDFYPFTEINKVLILPDRITISKILEPIYKEYREDIPRSSDWEFWGVDYENLKGEIECSTHSVFILHKSKVDFLTQQYILIEDECFRDLERFRDDILPLLKENNVEIVDNFKN